MTRSRFWLIGLIILLGVLRGVAIAVADEPTTIAEANRLTEEARGCAETDVEKARRLYRQARQAYGDVESESIRVSRTFPKVIDPNDEALREKRNATRQDLLQARLTLDGFPKPVH